MLVKNTNNKSCKHSIMHNGECCCNCKHRYTLFVNNVPLRFVCLIKEEGNTFGMTLRGSRGHDLCEMYENVDSKDIVFKNLYIE